MIPARNVQEPITFSLLCEGEVFHFWKGRTGEPRPVQTKKVKH